MSVERNLDELIHRITQLELIARRSKALGRVAPGGVKKGFVRVIIGTDNDGKPVLSPWVRTSEHAGFANQHTPYEDHQTVMVLSMDMDMRQAVVIPFSHTEHDPQGADTNTKKITQRVRDPETRKGKQGDVEETEHGASHRFDETPEIKDDAAKQQDDNKKDNYRREDYQGAYHRKKNMKHLRGEPDPEDKSDQEKGSGSTSPQTWTHLEPEEGGGSAGVAAAAAGGGSKRGSEMLQIAGLVRQTFGREDKGETDKGDESSVKAKSVIEQFAGKILRKVGDKAKVVHTASKVLHHLDDKSTVLHQAASWVRTMGDSTRTHLPSKLESIIGQVKHLTNEAGNFFTGGKVKHNDVNVGWDHQHWMPGRRMITDVPTENTGSGGGGGGGGSGPVAGSGGATPTPALLNADNVALAFGSFNGVTMVLGDCLNVAGVARISPGVYDVTMAEASVWPDHYTVQAQSSGVTTASSKLSETVFRISCTGVHVETTVTGSAAPFTVSTTTTYPLTDAEQVSFVVYP